MAGYRFGWGASAYCILSVHMDTYLEPLLRRPLSSLLQKVTILIIYNFNT